MPSTRELTRRIKSIKSTRKITRAMQLVSAAKMRKAQNTTIASRTYSNATWQLILNLSKSLEVKIDLLNVYPKAKKVGIILLSTNRGLVGSLNTNLGTKFKKIDRDTEIISELITYGKKGKNLAVKLNKNIIGDFEKLDKTITAEDIYPIAHFVTQAYKTGTYRQILIVYNYFVSTLTQKVTIKQLLPFSETIIEDTKKAQEVEIGKKDYAYNYLFEPDPKEVLEQLLPRIIESQLYQAILESNASEHSARMIMMKNATDAAGDLINDLTLTYNQIRQNKITTELAEITAGKIALE